MSRLMLWLLSLEEWTGWIRNVNWTRTIKTLKSLIALLCYILAHYLIYIWKYVCRYNIYLRYIPKGWQPLKNPWFGMISKNVHDCEILEHYIWLVDLKPIISTSKYMLYLFECMCGNTKQCNGGLLSLQHLQKKDVETNKDEDAM